MPPLVQPLIRKLSKFFYRQKETIGTRRQHPRTAPRKVEADRGARPAVLSEQVRVQSRRSADRSGLFGEKCRGTGEVPGKCGDRGTRHSYPADGQGWIRAP